MSTLAPDTDQGSRSGAVPVPFVRLDSAEPELKAEILAALPDEWLARLGG